MKKSEYKTIGYLEALTEPCELKITGSGKKSVKLSDFVLKEKKVNNLQVCKGVLYKDGQVVASNGAKLISIRADYPSENEGKIIAPNGKQIDMRYPAWDRILPFKGKPININALIATAKELESSVDKSKYDTTYIGVKDNRDARYRLTEVKNIAEVASKVCDCMAYVAERNNTLVVTHKGLVMLCMPVYFSPDEEPEVHVKTHYID